MFGFGTLVGGIDGVFVFIRITDGTGELSILISAPTLSVQSIVTSTEIVQAMSSVEPTLTPQLTTTHQFQAATSPRTDNSQPVRIIPIATFVPSTPTNSPPRRFRIVSEESEARFSVFETFPLDTAIRHTN